MNEILIFLLSLAGAFVLRVCGLGFGVFTMAWLPYLLPSYGEATTLSGILAMAGSILVAFKNWRKIDWHKLTPILITFIVSSCASIHFVSVADDHLLKRILGVMLIIASLWFLAISKHVKVKPTLPVQSPWAPSRVSWVDSSPCTDLQQCSTSWPAPRTRTSMWC